MLQFKMPRAELEKLEQAESEEAQRQILERFAQDLPITNRTVTGGKYTRHQYSTVVLAM
jgi:palmitoyltransferase